MDEKDIIEREFKQFKIKQLRNLLVAFCAMYATGFNPLIVRSKITDMVLFGAIDLVLIFGIRKDKEEKEENINGNS